MEKTLQTLKGQEASKCETTLFERFEEFLYSRKFVFTVVFAGIIPMILHSHQLFYDVSPFTGSDNLKNLYALTYAISFDLTILVFTIHVIKRKPVIYAIFSFIMNVLYFDPLSDLAESNYIKAFTKVFLSGVLAFTSYSYAELFVDKIIEHKKIKAEEAKTACVNNSVNGNGEEMEFECPECDESFPTIQARSGHMSKHRKKAKIV